MATKAKKKLRLRRLPARALSVRGGPTVAVANPGNKILNRVTGPVIVSAGHIEPFPYMSPGTQMVIFSGFALGQDVHYYIDQLMFEGVDITDEIQLFENVAWEPFTAQGQWLSRQTTPPMEDEGGEPWPVAVLMSFRHGARST